jgi:hypothetical protein
MTKPAREFLDDLWESFMPLHQVAEIQTRQFFAERGTDKQELESFFHIRLRNERQNMIELSKKVAELDPLTDPEECRLLAKQAWDEAEHYRIVYEILEHLTGKAPDLESIWSKVSEGSVTMGASLIKKYEAHNNPITMHLYQYMAEGRASHVWATMAQCAGDEFIEKHLLKNLADIIQEGSYKDAKSKFQEEAQERMSVTPNYKVMKESGPDHEKKFVVGVYLDKDLVAEGEGSSKQEAEEAAAELALDVKKWAS